MEGEYYLYKNWQFLFLGRPTYIRIRNRVEGHEEDEESNYVGSNNGSWVGSIESTGGRKYFLVYHQWIAYFEWLRKRQLGATNLRLVHVHLFFIALC